ncbi:MAG: DNA polymerase III subunit beta [Syntrophomonadaceae bacterium]|jgi:DNA polymerase-3 subunit beta|nr:DNA polymerase III subunit beta [Syntrophomonadaceae bacterium]
MKIEIQNHELLRLTNIVHRAASSKSNIPALSGLLIEVSEEKGLTFTATDMEIGIIASTQDIQIYQEGKVLVNSYYFANLIKVLPDATITMELDETKSKLIIYYSKSSVLINTYLDFEYPKIDIEEKKDRLSLKQSTLREALRKTIIAAAQNHFRQVFTGIYFDYTENCQLNCVASDTHRLAYIKYIFEETEIEPFNFILPIRTVHELLRTLENNDDIINIAASKNNVLFYKDNFYLLSRLLEGQYPTYSQVIPDSSTTNVKIKTSELMNTLERAKIMPTEDKIKLPSILFSIKENEISVNAFSEIVGEIFDVIENVEIQGEKNFDIAFNTNYLYDIIKLMSGECEEIGISISGVNAPVIIQNEKNENYLYVLVPLRTN